MDRAVNENTLSVHFPATESHGWCVRGSAHGHLSLRDSFHDLHHWHHDSTHSYTDMLKHTHMSALGHISQSV